MTKCQTCNGARKIIVDGRLIWCPACGAEAAKASEEEQRAKGRIP